MHEHIMVSLIGLEHSRAVSAESAPPPLVLFDVNQLKVHL